MAGVRHAERRMFVLSSRLRSVTEMLPHALIRVLLHSYRTCVQEKASVPLWMYVMYAFPRRKPILQTFRLIGPEESTMDQIRDLVKVGIDPL